MIVVTGAAGFIGSNMIARLNLDNYNYIIAVDDFSDEEKKKNLTGKKILEYVDRNVFFDWLAAHPRHVECIIHIGARTDTMLQDREVFDRLNLEYTKSVWRACVAYQIPLIYASSAATYGAGEYGYIDDESIIPSLRPLNPYGDSKNGFDIWALQQEKKPFFWAGLKFFNVYGPNEYHKSKMASVVYHAYHQIQETEAMKLFRSHNPEYKDGEQLRDFIYIKDVCEIIYYLVHHRKHSGIYNVGTGLARTFLDLVAQVFKAMDHREDISFIDTPMSIRDTYQYYTQADMTKLRSIGYDKPFYTLEAGVLDYVQNYLMSQKYI